MLFSQHLSGVWDHPRSRGEHRGKEADGLGKMGSSPLARGAQPG